MAYTINRTNGQNPIVIPDGTLNNETTVILVGKNYPNYGAILDQNFLRLLENSSNVTAPDNPITGELWWDSLNKTLKVYTGTVWKNVGSTTSSATKPTGNNNVGDLWWDSVNAQLWAYDGNALDYILIGPIGGSGGIVSENLYDTSLNPKPVISFNLEGSRYAILSDNAVFTPNTPIPGFANVRPGFNLASTTFLPNARLVGTATNADALNNVAASNFMRSDIATSTTGTLSVLNNNGLYVGSANTGHISVSSPNFIIANETNNGIMNFRVKNSGGSTLNAMDIYPNGNVVANFDLSVAGNINFTNTTNDLVITGASPSVNYLTGALRLNPGGLGVAGNINSNGSSSNFTGNVRAGNLIANTGVSASTVTATTIAGTLTTGAQTNITSVGTLTSLSVTGSVSAASYSGTLLTAAQTNITSVGTLTGLTVSGTTTLGSVSNVKITGGSSGNYLTTDGAGNLSFSAITGTTNGVAYFSGSGLTGGSNFTWNGTTAYVNGSLNVTGDITAYYSSDIRLKTDIETIDNALSKVNKLRGISYSWNEVGRNSFDIEFVPEVIKDREIGVIAQEVQEVLPEIVTQRANGYLAVRYERLVPLLIEAIKELSAQVEALQGKKSK